MKEDPIQDFESIDIVVEKDDGKVELCVVVSSFLDESEYHEELLRRKVQAYVTEISSEAWMEKYGVGNSSICIKSTEVPHQEIINLIGAMKNYLEGFNIELFLEIV